MRSPTTQAGGLFLMLGIVGGTIWGMTTSKVMFGVLTGTGIGIALAVATWLIDRGRDTSR